MCDLYRMNVTLGIAIFISPNPNIGFAFHQHFEDWLNALGTFYAVSRWYGVLRIHAQKEIVCG